jgi:hypothetical protein
MIASLALLLAGCGALTGSTKTETADEKDEFTPSRRPVVVEMPWDTSGRDDASRPVVQVVVYDDGAHGVPVPHFYGYPLWAKGEATNGIRKLRHENWTGAETEQREDEHGVIYYTERLPELDCVIEGIRETEIKLVPLTLTCEVPPPKKLGGKKRAVVGAVKAGARPDEILDDPTIKKAFLGEWHAVSEDFDSGNGTGYFNSDYGLLAFGFKRNRLSRVIFYFNPAEKAWWTPMLWVKP